MKKRERSTVPLSKSNRDKLSTISQHVATFHHAVTLFVKQCVCKLIKARIYRISVTRLKHSFSAVHLHRLLNLRSMAVR
jgi:hypothetical protein